ncbi:MAG: crossover junction endodeoxyribonuclease RuvC [Bacteriovoracaceae bacterium]|jgi:crossover junction endodeoxyribonuclease RuvC|nr:crossover junction endodeoxyribonuclease RuvC [Bacteriovoracaceae bacterium]
MLVLGIDPGSVTTGWALLKSSGNKVHYVASGILKFDQGTDFLDRLTQIKKQTQSLLDEVSPDCISLESLIYVKSPTALIKLAQTRGIILSCMVEKYQGKIFEYSPNLVKSSAVGHGHADKESVKKVLDMLLGKREYKSHDESDAVAIALCHILNNGNGTKLKSKSARKGKGKGLAGSLSHAIKG